MSENNNLRILIIDDNPEIHRDFIKILTTDNSTGSELERFEKIFGTQGTEKGTFPEFRLDMASQGQEGVRRIAQALQDKTPYALAFVDIRMPPGWDGIETIKHIWALDPDIQIVICTAYSDYTWEQTVAELGQRENLLILKKPFDHVAVRQLSCALTKKWQLLRESHDYTKSLEETVKERTQQLQQSLSITRGTLESAADGILVVDSKNHIIDFNHKLLEIWNISPVIIEKKDGKALLESIASQVENPENFSKILKDSIMEKTALRIEKLKTRDHRVFEHYSQHYKLNDKIAGRIWSFRDITKRAALEEAIVHQATHDTLTGLPNRALLTDRIQQMISLSKRNNGIFAVLFLDLDRFKLINDSFNHTAGDQLLQLVAKRIKFAIRTSDTIARVGGDEFIGVVPLTSEDVLSTIIKKILGVFEQSFKIADRDIMVSVSIGISIFPRDGETIDELLCNADIAMYRAKELGGNQFQIYSSEINHNTIERLEIESDLHKAIKNHEFFLYYQPEIDLINNKMISAETLIRWQHPLKGLLLPVDFIPIAEKTGLIVSIGEWVLREACKQNKKWQEMGLAKIRVTVNISSNQFKSPNFVALVKTVLEETQLEPEYLELELTENLLIGTSGASDVISELKKLGVYISLDDFGTGYSSLNYLRNIHIDSLKIDQSFVKNIGVSSDDEIIIQAIISMARALKLDTVAEGVETQKQLEFLKSKECVEGQGYYFSKPVTHEELEALLRTHYRTNKN